MFKQSRFVKGVLSGLTGSSKPKTEQKKLRRRQAGRNSQEADVAKIQINVWALAVAIVKGVAPLIRALGKKSAGGKKVTPEEVDEILGTILTVGEAYFAEHVD